MPYPVESALSGIQRTEDRMWYRRTFDVPSSWRGGHGWCSTSARSTTTRRVWVNGNQVDHAPRRLRRVLASTSPPRSRSTGRRRSIVGVEDLTDDDVAAGRQAAPGARPRHLLHRQLGHLADGVAGTGAGRHITKLDMTPDARRQHAAADRAATAIEGTVEAVAYDGGRVVGKVTRPGEPASCALPVPNAKLWSPDSPFLYDLRCPLLDRQARRSTRSARTSACARSARRRARTASCG